MLMYEIKRQFNFPLGWIQYVVIVNSFTVFQSNNQAANSPVHPSSHPFIPLPTRDQSINQRPTNPSTHPSTKPINHLEAEPWNGETFDKQIASAGGPAVSSHDSNSVPVPETHTYTASSKFQQLVPFRLGTQIIRDTVTTTLFIEFMHRWPQRHIAYHCPARQRPRHKPHVSPAH